MRRPVRGGNTISVVQSSAVNGTAREISPLSPEEQLRTKHLSVFCLFVFFSSLWQATVTPNQTCHRDTAACRTEGRGNEMNRDEESVRGKYTSPKCFLCLSRPFVLFYPLFFFISPCDIPTPLFIYPSVSITSHPFCLLSPPLALPLHLSAYTPRSLLDFQRETGTAAAGIQTS